ncbi:PAS domain S-box protein [Gracilimonas sp. Q87]|uniref:PAS domain-containing sensor histidine kinase n=1 Tax=Gracilimonas sp. Q87 TaxID=3384766 RepID=UPI0039843FA7
MGSKIKSNYLKKELYELIKTDESIFDFIQEGPLDGLWYRDLESPENMWMNNRFWEVLGYDPEDMPHKSAAWQDIIHEDDLAITNENFRKHSENPKHLYNQLVRYTHKNGSTVWIRCRGMIIRDETGKPVRLLGAHHDITETKNKELGAEKASLRDKSYHLANIGHWELDLVHDVLYWSTEVKNLHEVDQDYQPDVETAIDFYPEGKYRTAIQQAVHEAIENGKAYDLELKITTAKGNEKWIRTTGDAIQERGTCIKLYGSTQDISKRKQAEMALEKSEEQFRIAQELSPDGFTILHPLRNEQNEIIDFVWVYQNQTIARINGTQDQDVIGKRLLDVFPTHKGTEIFDSYVEVSSTGKPKVLQDVYAGEVLSEPTWLRLVITSMGEEIAILAQDVSERKQAEQELQFQSKITENLAEGVYLIRSSDGAIVYTNPTFDHMFGYDSGELIGKHVSILNAPTNKNPEEKAEEVIQALTEKGTWSGEIHNIKKNGTEFWCIANVSTFKHIEYGEVWVSVHNDITERKKAEEELKRITRIMSNSQEIAHLGSFEYIAATQSTIWSDEEYRIYGLDPSEPSPEYDEMLEKYIHPEDAKLFDDTFKAAMQNREVYELEHRIVRPEGDVRWVYDKAHPYFDQDGNLLRYVGATLDITEQKKIELALRESEARFRRAVIGAPFPIMIHAEDGEVVTVNTPWTCLTGYEHSDIPTIADWTLKAYGTKMEPVRSYIDSLYALDESKAEGEFKITTSSGNSRIWDFSSAPIGELPDGRRLVISMAMDITERKKTEEKLKLFNRAIEASSVSVVITDSEGSIDYVNPYFTEITGYSFEEVYGRNPRILKSGKQSEAFYEDLWHTIKSGKIWTGEFQNVKKNGELYWEKAIISPILDEDTGEITHFVAIKEDITKLLEKEDELKQSLKEKEIMLAEIHHRVKNNLAVVSAMLQLQSFDEENPEVLERLSASTSRIKTIANIHESLYQNETFSRIDISENIRKLTHNIARVFNIGKNIKIDFSLEQVQLNINQAVPCSLIVNEVLINAFRHAFTKEKGGNISVHLSEQDNQVQLKIKDNGIGLPDDFGKKSHSSGTMIIQVLTEQLDGEHQYKRVDTGTEFTLTFGKKEIKGSSSTILKGEIGN